MRNDECRKNDEARKPHVISSLRDSDFELLSSFVICHSSFTPLHPHYLIATVHINHLPGDGGGAVARQEGSGRAKFVGQHIAFERRMSFVLFEHLSESRNTSGGQRVHWAGVDAVDPNF